MRSTFAALVVAVAMLLPTAALASGWGCDGEYLVLDRCCGSSQDEDHETPRLLSSCCCDLQQGRTVSVDDAPVILSADQQELPPAVEVIADIAPARPARAPVVVPSRARPPPPPTLFALHVSLLC
jgi:hypothetical protein